MSVIVINFARWPSYVTLLRTDALDLYAKGAGVEFWDTTPLDRTAAPGSDFSLWGHWPQRLGDSPNRVAAELLDSIAHRLESERLTVIVLLDRVADAVRLPIAASLSSGTPGAIVTEIGHRLQQQQNANVLRHVAFVAAIRFGGHEEAERAAAFGLSGDPSSLAIPFRVAVFLGDEPGRTGTERDRATLDGLRVLIDVARDPAAAVALWGALRVGSREGRVLVLKPPLPRNEPAADLRHALVELLDAAVAAAEDRHYEKGDRSSVESVTDQVIATVEGTDLAKAVAKSRTDERSRAGEGRPDLPPNADLERLWSIPRPTAENWLSVLDVGVGENSADALLRRSTIALGAYDRSRQDRLKQQRRDLDAVLRDKRRSLLGEMHAACVDPSFGLAQRFTGRLDEQRGRLALRFGEWSENATRWRAEWREVRGERPEEPAAALGPSHDALVAALGRWLSPAKVFRAAAMLGLATLYVAVVLMIAPERRSLWPLVSVGVMAGVALLGLAILDRQRRFTERERSTRANLLAEAERQWLRRIDEVTDKALSHVAAGHTAGGVVPFIETQRRHARDHVRHRKVMESARTLLSAGHMARGGEVAVALAARPGADGQSVSERFRALLWRHEPRPPVPATIAFTTKRGDVSFPSSIAFAHPIAMEVVGAPPPPVGARPVQATAPAGRRPESGPIP